jgi:hypothetical protein
MRRGAEEGARVRRDMLVGVEQSEERERRREAMTASLSFSASLVW